MMSEVSESLLMEGWCSPETTKNITNDVLPPVSVEDKWLGRSHTSYTDYFHGVFCPFWSLTDLFTVLVSSNKSYKLTKGLIRATEAAQDQTTAAMENQDRLCFYLLPYQKK